jgi:hypothetical protein
MVVDFGPQRVSVMRMVWIFPILPLDVQKGSSGTYYALPSCGKYNLGKKER